MEGTKIDFKSEDKFEDLGDLQKNIYQILKLELGYYLSEKYEEAMDSFAISTSLNETNYYESFTAIVRKIKNCLIDTKVQNLTNYIIEQRTLIKDDFMTNKTRRNIGIVIDVLDNINKSLSKIVYDILQEVKFGYLKKFKGPYLIISDYFELKIKKKYDSLEDFINDSYTNLEKVINLAYGGI